VPTCAPALSTPRLPLSHFWQAWFRRLLGSPSYQELDAEAATAPPGADGLVLLEHFQGRRTPPDGQSRGALAGLSLAHSRGTVWRAVLEGVALGMRAVLDAADEGGAAATPPFRIEDISIAGGACRSELWLQIHADVLGRELVITEGATDACVLGSAVLAAIGTRRFDDLDSAAAAMVRTARVVRPGPNATAYDSLRRRYAALYPALVPIHHAVAAEAEAKGEGDGKGARAEGEPAGARAAAPTDQAPRASSPSPPTVVACSVLAADQCSLGADTSAALDAGCEWIHVDMSDNGRYAPGVVTLGVPQVAALARAFPDTLVDVHAAVSDPYALVDSLCAAGAGQISFMIDAVAEEDAAPGGKDGAARPSLPREAAGLAGVIRARGVRAGVSVIAGRDEVSVDSACALAAAGMVDCVNVLAVEPSVGGQTLRPVALDVVRRLRAAAPAIDIQIDGGVCPDNATACRAAGANILVAGTAVFGAPADQRLAVVAALRGM